MTTSDSPPAQEVIPAESDYPLLDQPQAMQSVLRLINENLGEQQFNVLNLPKVKLSRDGVFQIETAGGVETERSITGVITAFRQARIYWGRPYTGQNLKQPPSCTSMDGFIGVGDPGGDCTKCPYAQFKTARNPDGSQGAGQACKELRQLLILLPGQMMPHRLDVPPTSIQAFTKYSLNLVYAGASYWSVVTRLGLEQGPSASGIPVVRAQFSLYKRLSPEQTKLLEPYHERMTGLLKPMTVDADAYEVADEAGPRPRAMAGPRGDDDIPF